MRTSPLLGFERENDQKWFGPMNVLYLARIAPPPPQYLAPLPPTQGIMALAEYAYLSGTSVLCQHGAFSHFFRLFSTFGVMHQNVVTLGGGMCMLFEICGKTPFQKCMGWGG